MRTLPSSFVACSHYVCAAKLRHKHFLLDDPRGAKGGSRKAAPRAVKAAKGVLLPERPLLSARQIRERGLHDPPAKQLRRVINAVDWMSVLLTSVDALLQV